MPPFADAANLLHHRSDKSAGVSTCRFSERYAGEFQCGIHTAVDDLEDELNSVGYFIGWIPGVFGPLEAVGQPLSAPQPVSRQDVTQLHEHNVYQHRDPAQRRSSVLVRY